MHFKKTDWVYTQKQIAEGASAVLQEEGLRGVSERTLRKWKQLFGWRAWMERRAVPVGGVPYGTPVDATVVQSATAACKVIMAMYDAKELGDRRKAQAAQVAAMQQAKLVRLSGPDDDTCA